MAVLGHKITDELGISVPALLLGATSSHSEPLEAREGDVIATVLRRSLSVHQVYLVSPNWHNVLVDKDEGVDCAVVEVA